MRLAEGPLVSTIKERCRLCYTCVRECPAKAIRIVGGQAEVLANRCIGCGNCVRVCSQRAKRVYNEVGRVEQLLRSGERVAALLAPSFPAEFSDIGYEFVVGMLRALGFHQVHEVGFGADLVARQYRQLLAGTGHQRFIATTCPAIVGYVERYMPNLVGRLAPIVSPMVATARALHHIHGGDLRLVFIGPCIAKKGEAESDRVRGDVDAVLTFTELRELLRTRAIKAEMITPSEFDPPHAAQGALFPISRGMLQAARIQEDLLSGDVVAAEGQSDFIQVLKDFEGGDLDARLVEVLCCKGCIMGPGYSDRAAPFRRRAMVSRFARRRTSMVLDHWQDQYPALADLDLTCQFTLYDQRLAAPSDGQLSEIMSRMGKVDPEDELNCGACGYETCREHAVAIYKGLAENEMCLPYTIEQLRRTCRELAQSNEERAEMQEALVQSEKLASMGQLAAGIAHEVNNPLGTVLMLSHLMLEDSADDHRRGADLRMIVSEAERCKRIVAGLLHFARKNEVNAKTVVLRDLLDRLVRTLHAPEGVRVDVQCGDGDLTAELDEDQILQVLTNLAANAFAAMPEGGTLTIGCRGDGAQVCFWVRDTGVGMSPDILKKIFEPFFTTKRVGHGTGLGLAVSYGIVKMHRGDIRVESNADPTRGPTGSTFIVTLPAAQPRDDDGNGFRGAHTEFHGTGHA